MFLYPFDLLVGRFDQLCGLLVFPLDAQLHRLGVLFRCFVTHPRHGECAIGDFSGLLSPLLFAEFQDVIERDGRDEQLSMGCEIVPGGIEVRIFLVVFLPDVKFLCPPPEVIVAF